MLQAALVWLLFGLVAFAGGGFRQVVLVPSVGEQLGHQLGTLLVAGVIGVIAAVFTRRIRPSPGGAVRIGLLWALMSVAFELGFFHFGRGVPLDTLLADYNILAGRLWPLVLLVQLVTPSLVVRTMQRAA